MIFTREFLFQTKLLKQVSELRIEKFIIYSISHLIKGVEDTDCLKSKFI